MSRSPSHRPARAMVAGAVQVTLGLLSIPYLLSVMAAVRRAGALGEADAILILVLVLVQGLLDLTAGVLILRLRPAGWTLGVLMASFGAVFALLSLGRAPGLGVVAGILLRVTVVVLLSLDRDRFRPRESPRG